MTDKKNHGSQGIYLDHTVVLSGVPAYMAHELKRQGYIQEDLNGALHKFVVEALLQKVDLIGGLERVSSEAEEKGYVPEIK